MTEDCSEIIRVMNDLYRMDISHFDQEFVANMIQKRLDITGATFAEYLAYLSDNPGEADSLSSSLYVSFSEFFRNPLTFAVLETVILPHLIEQKRKNGKGGIRIWSAGCSAGQECYSLAILLQEQISARDSPATYRICATDISDYNLGIGRKGMFPSIMVQNVRLKHLSYLMRTDHDCWQVDEELIKSIDFSLYNLLDVRSTSPPAGIFGDFDLIFCSNVLYYYKPESQKFIISKLRHALAEDGFLVCGETERAFFYQSGFFLEICSPSAVYKKVFQGRE